MEHASRLTGIKQIDVEDDDLLINLIIDVPFERRGESLTELLPGTVGMSKLRMLTTELLGREMTIEVQTQIRYRTTIEPDSESGD